MSHIITQNYYNTTNTTMSVNFFTITIRVGSYAKTHYRIDGEIYTI